ncbi:MAG: YpdA family putative bacillithiol disulfide reductase [Gemmatimonadaceae bacterium]
MKSDSVLDLLIVGAGPCGLACAISAMRSGLHVEVLESSVVVASIAQYPTYATFFSTAEKLSLGDLPFIIPGEKPTRRDALAYYRSVVRHFRIPVRQQHRVTRIDGVKGDFRVQIALAGDLTGEIRAKAIVIATGYFGSPNRIGVPGENLPHVTHIYHEGHEAFDQDVVVAGGGNSAAEAALDLWRCGARVTLVHFGPGFDKKIKPWVLPDFDNRVKEGAIAVRWNARIVSINPQTVITDSAQALAASRVYLMTGFAPNTDLLAAKGVPIDATTGVPSHDPSTLETAVAGIFIAGVVVAGYDANKVFIENGRFHGDKIVASLTGAAAPSEPRLSAELDT